MTMLRVGSFALTAAGSTRKVHATPFGAAGRDSFALNLIVPVDLAMAEKVALVAIAHLSNKIV
ncbi:MAG TPA: hypothetical protein VFX93_03530, partial [Xanthomonadaceae bacterium]|nr:hypothetical protein [Xanthomonadaceae bacterium]